MKNFLVTTMVILAACAVAYGVCYAMGREPAALRQAMAERNAMEWLRADFALSDTQFAAIKQLHDDYGKECARHCAAIMDAKRRHAPAAEIGRLEATCERSMAGHFHQVAALMDPAQGRRYLAIVLPRVVRYDHHGAPSVRVSP
jgi:hypothetical protein